MKIYNKPEIETLALEMIDVITASVIEEGDITTQLNNAGLTDEQIKEMNESLDTMQKDNWNW